MIFRFRTDFSMNASAAKVTRQALKTGPLKDAAAKRDITNIKFQKWENGKAVGAKY